MYEQIAVENNKMLTSRQFSFRKRHDDTELAVTLFTDNIRRAMVLQGGLLLLCDGGFRHSIFLKTQKYTKLRTF